MQQPRTSARVSLTALLGTPVTDAQGHIRGKLKDIAVATGPDAGKVAGLVLKTRSGLALVPAEEVMRPPRAPLSCARQPRCLRSLIRTITSFCSRIWWIVRLSTSTAARLCASMT